MKNTAFSYITPFNKCHLTCRNGHFSQTKDNRRNPCHKQKQQKIIYIIAYFTQDTIPVSQCNVRTLTSIQKLCMDHCYKLKAASILFM